MLICETDGQIDQMPGRERRQAFRDGGASGEQVAADLANIPSHCLTTKMHSIHVVVSTLWKRIEQFRGEAFPSNFHHCNSVLTESGNTISFASFSRVPGAGNMRGCKACFSSCFVPFFQLFSLSGRK